MSTFLRRQAVLMSLSSTDTEKKVAGLVYNDANDGISSKDLNNLAALTFNPKPAEEIYRVLASALDPQVNTWQTLLKAVVLVDHLVKFGAERCVDLSWAVMKRLEELADYNSATVKNSMGTVTGGRDNGAPVRVKCGPLVQFLSDPNAIRQFRTSAHESQGALCPGVGDSDFSAKGGPLMALSTGDVVAADGGGPKVSVSSDSRAYGSAPGQALAAKFDLSHVPGMYEGRPDRFYENAQDSRRGSQAVEDSHITRNALAPDLLDMDFGAASTVEASANNLPPTVENLAQQQQEAQLRAQLEAQQRELQALQQALQNNGINGSGLPASMAQPQMPQQGMVIGAMPPPAAAAQQQQQQDFLGMQSLNSPPTSSSSMGASGPYNGTTGANFAASGGGYMAGMPAPPPMQSLQQHQPQQQQPPAMNWGAMNQSGMNQGGMGLNGMNQGSMSGMGQNAMSPQGGMNQGGMGQSSMGQGGMSGMGQNVMSPQGGMNQGGMEQGGMSGMGQNVMSPQGGMNQGGMGQSSMGQGGMSGMGQNAMSPQGGMNQGGMGQNAVSANGMNQGGVESSEQMRQLQALQAQLAEQQRLVQQQQQQGMCQQNGMNGSGSVGGLPFNGL